MKKLLLLFTLAFFYILNVNAQKISSEQLNLLNGEWMGTLSYTDYSDDKSQFELKTKLIAAFKKGKGVLKFIYTEPNGKIVKGKEKIRLNEDNNTFYFSGEYSIIDFEEDSNSANWKLILENEGSDNNKPATIQQVVTLEGNKFSIAKMVRYKDQDGFIQRNKYTLERN